MLYKYNAVKFMEQFKVIVKVGSKFNDKVCPFVTANVRGRCIKLKLS